MLVIISALDDSIPTTDMLAFVIIDASAGQTGALVTLELNDSLIQRFSLTAITDQSRRKSLTSRTVTFLKRTGFKCVYHFQETLMIIDEIQKYRHMSSELDEVFPNLFANGFIFFFLFREFLFFF